MDALLPEKAWGDCHRCKGKGRIPDGSKEGKQCPKCHGTGAKPFNSRKCPKCGAKWEYSNNHPFCWCSKCSYIPGDDHRWVVARQWEIIEEQDRKIKVLREALIESHAKYLFEVDGEYTMKEAREEARQQLENGRKRTCR